MCVDCTVAPACAHQRDACAASRGGKARAKMLTAGEGTAIGKKGAGARWPKRESR